MAEKNLRRLVGSFVIIIFLSGTSRAVVISTVPVGSPGNAPALGVGAVSYVFSIGKYDVTYSQYAEFLNAKARTADPFGLWSSVMDTQSGSGWQGITRSQSAPYSYAVAPGYANKPVIGLTWYSTVRFVNWLQNGQGSGDTESGTYTITGGGFNSGTVVVPNATQRAIWATTNSFHWLLPSENESYKAAYYNAQNGTYYRYPFQNNSFPDIVAPPGTSNSGNYRGSQAFNYDGNGSYLTDVGAYPNSVSPFGSYDMGGNVEQWNDTPMGAAYGLAGGDWDSSVPESIFPQGVGEPYLISGQAGFRVASVGGVPEPSTGLLAALAFGVIWLGRKRFKPSA
jgi:formylglycine-generating enzyme required for sulfatase activity